jgi:hypothetical protein
MPFDLIRSKYRKCVKFAFFALEKGHADLTLKLVVDTIHCFPTYPLQGCGGTCGGSAMMMLCGHKN